MLNSFILRLSKTGVRRAQHGALSAAVILAASLPSAVSALQASPECSGGVTIQGIVRGVDGKPVKDAVVHLVGKPSVGDQEIRTSADGEFLFPSIRSESFEISAGKAGLFSPTSNIKVPSESCGVHIDLNLQPAGLNVAPGKSSASLAQAMEFADQPNFTIAGVTDWTAVGGHGSDSTLRTTEDLANETRSLKPEHSDSRSKGLEDGVGNKLESENELRTAVAGAPKKL